MMRPSPGLMATLNSQPVEFLHLIRDLDHGAEEWLVKPLFVVAPNHLVTYRPGDRVTPLHSRHS